MTKKHTPGQAAHDFRRAVMALALEVPQEVWRDFAGYAESLFEEHKEMLAMLERLEWTSDSHGEYCPECAGWSHIGHEPDCHLDLILTKARGEKT